MSATSTLRARLSAAGIEYGRLGDYTTYVTSRGYSWTLTDDYDGTLNVHAVAVSPEVAAEIVGGARGVAHVRSTYDDDGVGHSECGACGRTVGEWFRYCPWCGARFTEIERTCKA